jgi:hypothetical protein
VIDRFVASHSITGSLTDISALSGKIIFWAKIVQNPSHITDKIPSTTFFIL